MEACGDTGIFIHLWGGDEISFKKDVVKAKNKTDPAISLPQIYLVYLHVFIVMMLITLLK